MSDFDKIVKLIETYDLIERCYRAIEELFKKQIDIDTLTESQCNIANLICDIVGTDDLEWIFMELAVEGNASEKAKRIIDSCKNEGN